MINHVRSLLNNQNNQIGGSASGNLGAELIDPGFQPLTLPQPLLDVQRAILPLGYTPYQRNLTLASVMQLLHSPELEPYTLVLDSRIAYKIPDAYALQISDSVVEVTEWKNSACDVTFEHLILLNERWVSTGTVLNWELRHTPELGIQVEVRFEDKTTQAYPVTFVSGRSSNLVLIPDHLAVRFKSPSNALTGTFKYDISFHAPVAFDVANLLEQFKMLNLRAGTANLIFNSYLPYVTQIDELRQIWLHSNEALLRVGAFILAFAYRCEHIRSGETL